MRKLCCFVLVKIIFVVIIPIPTTCCYLNAWVSASTSSTVWKTLNLLYSPPKSTSSPSSSRQVSSTQSKPILQLKVLTKYRTNGSHTSLVTHLICILFNISKALNWQTSALLTTLQSYSQQTPHIVSLDVQVLKTKTITKAISYSGSCWEKVLFSVAWPVDKYSNLSDSEMSIQTIWTTTLPTSTHKHGKISENIKSLTSFHCQKWILITNTACLNTLKTPYIR